MVNRSAALSALVRDAKLAVRSFPANGTGSPCLLGGGSGIQNVSVFGEHGKLSSIPEGELPVQPVGFPGVRSDAPKSH